ncbi:hypothetical protein MTYP_02220 [Methylophilaceae bacterium]|nr:hypothetical protein MTYP_02220 [Methylophilaceae bacterium]
MTVRIKVWDLPLRVFHWILVAAVVSAFVTGQLGGSLSDWHGRIGLLILGLLIFRLIWGVAGSHYARFANLPVTPAELVAHAKGQWQGYGHNPLGSISVMVLLGLLFVQVGTGLFANDDIAFQGPLFNLVDKDLSDKLSGLHALVFNFLVGMVALHLVAIGFYFFIKKTNLVKPMLTGEKEVKKSEELPSTRSGGIRFFIAVVISGVLVWVIQSDFFLEHLQPYQKNLPAVQDW